MNDAVFFPVSEDECVEDPLLALSILIIDDEPGIRSFLSRALARRCALVEAAASLKEAEALRRRYHFDAILLDLRIGEENGLSYLQDIRGQGVGTEVILMTAFADLQSAITAIREDVADFILKPFRVDQMLESLRQTFLRRKIRRENHLLRRQLNQLHSAPGIIGNSPAVLQMISLLERIGPTNSTVLISGETGTGKELVASAIHKISQRQGAFVAVNCGTISQELLESELFGHTRGAFTGAAGAREGLFLHADKGTIFLDEIGEMPLSMQAKLLRVLEQRSVRAVGAEREQPIDVRVVAATNRDLRQEVLSGRFREDLFYRLEVMPIAVPALRERAEDVVLLAEYFMQALGSELRLPPIPLNSEQIKQLSDYHWPGNVRELKNVIERSLLLGELSLTTLPAADKPLAHGFSLSWSLAKVERAHIEAVLAEHAGNKTEAARCLGVSRKTLERKSQLWQEEINE